MGVFLLRDRDLDNIKVVDRDNGEFIVVHYITDDRVEVQDIVVYDTDLPEEPCYIGEYGDVTELDVSYFTYDELGYKYMYEHHFEEIYGVDGVMSAIEYKGDIYTLDLEFTGDTFIRYMPYTFKDYLW